MKLFRIFRLSGSTASRLSHRFVSSAFWALTLQISDRLVSLIRVVVLARLLVPESFGLLGVAVLFMAVIDAFSWPGYTQALIYKKGDITTYLNTTWTILFLRGVGIGLIMFLGAGYAANFLGAPEAKPVIQALAINPILNGLFNPGVIYFEKDLQFYKVFIYKISQSITGVIVPIILALLWRNVWALVIGMIAGNIVGLALSYIIQPYRPRLQFELKVARELFTFGRWITLSVMITFLATQLDKGAVSRFLGPVSLGLYQVGYNISYAATGAVGSAVSEVAFPAYSKLQDNNLQLRQAFLKIMESTICITLPITLILFLLADGLVGVVLGPQWLLAIPVVKYIALASFLGSFIKVCGALFDGIGRPRLEMQLYLVEIIIIVSLLYPLTNLMGISGASLSVLGGMVAALPFLIYYLFSHLKLGFRDLMKALYTPLTSGLTIGVVTILAKLVFNSLTVPGLAVILLLDLLVFVGINYAFWKKFKTGPIQALALLGIGSRIKTSESEL
jgi:O-antigen/teichoic acid export membrane protein